MTILVGLGSNLPGKGCRTPGDTVRAAIQEISNQKLGNMQISPLYTSVPVPKSEQPWFVNAIIALENCMFNAAEELLGRLHRIEDHFGRRREGRWAARTLDLDLLAFDEAIIGWRGHRPGPDDGRLVVPHMRLHERLFVLRPLEDILPDWRHPVFDRSVADLLVDLAPGQVVEPVPKG